MTQETPSPGDKNETGDREFGSDGYWHYLDDIVWRDDDGYIKGSW